MLTVKLARKAVETTADVLTPEGDAGVIGRIYTFTRETSHGYRDGRYLIGQAAFVTGEHIYGWYLLTELSPSRTLLDLPDKI